MMRLLLRRPHLMLGLAGIPGAQNLLLAHGKKIGQSFILNESCRHACSTFAGSIYEHAVKHRELVVIDDLARHPAPTQVEQEILKQEVLALFSIAVKRSLDELNDRIEAVIKAQCTAIHLAVEWRFRRAALKYLRDQYDEKKFDVDGTYNVRCEIMKKRIDKAIVKGTQERLTQPRKIAIVYSQAREAAEYREYIDYLQSSGYLNEEVEELELEDLQGVHGLYALRVSVNLHASFITPPKQKLPETDPAIEEMAEAMA